MSFTNKCDRILIKLGGSALLNDSVVDRLAEAVLQYQKFGFQVIVVHGGGPAINAELSRRGIEWKFIEGQRVTTPEMIESIEMVLKGSVNGKVVRKLNSKGIAAFGLSGAECGILGCTQASSELQRVGKITSVNRVFLEKILNSNSKGVPVLAPLGVGENEEIYNINADWAAAQLGIALEVSQILYLTDQKGIWDEQRRTLSRLNEIELAEMIESGVVQGGMLAKVRTILACLDSGIRSVRVLHAEEVLRGLWSDSVGTFCVRQDYQDHLQSLEAAYASF